MEANILDAMVGKLKKQDPLSSGQRMASVAVILENAAGPRALLIKRADRTGDPWSGQVAFPGGKAQDGELSARATAIREAQEEVGVDLETDARFLGYLDAFRTHTGTMDVVPSVFLLEQPVDVRVNDEVASYRWVELAEFLSPQSRTMHEVSFGGETRLVPAFRIGDYVVWGLTHRILSSLIVSGEST